MSSYTSATDADESFRATMQQHRRLLTRVVSRAAGPVARNDVEDIEQEVVVALWKQLARGRAIDHPAAYLRKAAVRAAFRTVCRLRARAADPIDEHAPAAAGAHADPARRVEAREQREALRAALRSLAADRGVAVRGHLAGFSVHEIMAVTGWPYQRARNLIARGMADLRATLAARLVS